MPCTFWLATAYALAGRTDEAEAILNGAEAEAGGPGVFGEEVESQGEGMLGNLPLVFSQIEYVRGVMELEKSHPIGMLRLMAGKVTQFFTPAQ